MAKPSLTSLSNKKKAKMPADILPMLATLVDEAPSQEEEWLYEIKWDGFRTLAYLDKGKVELRSRNNKVFNEKFYPIHAALEKLKLNAVFDGETVVLNDKGLPDFSALQLWRSEADGELVYYVFDILWYEGYDLMSVPLSERKELLKQVLSSAGMVRRSETLEGSPEELFGIVDQMGLEGLIAKKATSIYKPDMRSKEWLKIKMQRHQEAVIGGFTRNEGSPKKFSALLLGIYEGKELLPITPVGTGFNAKMQTEIMEKLQPLITSKCPFPFVPDFNKPSRFRPNPPRAEVTWVKPKLVAEIAYQTIASDGSYRHPSFKGLRPDKDPKDVVHEEAQHTKEVIDKEHKLVKGKVLSAPRKRERKTLLNPTDESQVRNVNGHDLKFTSLSKLYWPKDKVTKRDLINYYYQVAPYILPYLKSRPQTLNRFPNGIDKDSFYQKDVKGKVPGWMETFDYYSYTDQREKEFLLINNEATLLYAANLGCIEMNPWSSRTDKPDNPDFCIIDLDPDTNPFSQVIETAQVTKEVLDAIGVPSWCKTSGSTGLHIYIPLGAKYTYEDSKEFGRALAKIIHRQLPKFTSIERNTKDRKGKLYIDFLQNRPQATVAAAYSLRPKPGATISMPLEWREVKKGLAMKDFNIRNAIDRLKETGDIFKGVLGKGIDMGKALKKLESEIG
jgi:bifunctional non-homologous end joining protein LigD